MKRNAIEQISRGIKLQYACSVCGIKFSAKMHREKCFRCRRKERLDSSVGKAMRLQARGEVRLKNYEEYLHGRNKSRNSASADYALLMKDLLDGGLKDKLSDMKYSEYILSPYWRIVSRYKRGLSGHRCEECGGAERLNVHHVTYNYDRGLEVYKNAIVVLCRSCHIKKHTTSLTLSIGEGIQKNNKSRFIGTRSA